MRITPVEYFGGSRYLTSRVAEFIAEMSAIAGKGDNDFLFIDPYSIGDVVHSVGFLPAFRRVYCEEGQRIVVLCQRRAAALAAVMPYADDIVGADLVQHEMALEYVASLTNTLSPSMPIICCNDMHAMGRLVRVGAHPLAIKRGIQFLRQDEPFTPPVVSDDLRRRSDAKMIAAGMIPGRSLLIAPLAMSFNTFSIDFWAKLVAGIADRLPNLAVFTDVTTGNGLIPSTLPVHIELEELIPAVEFAGHGLFLRSGLVDLCSWTSANLVSIVPPKWLWKHISTDVAPQGLFSKAWFDNSHVRDLYIETDAEHEIAKIIEALSGVNRGQPT